MDDGTGFGERSMRRFRWWVEGETGGGEGCRRCWLG